MNADFFELVPLRRPRASSRSRLGWLCALLLAPLAAGCINQQESLLKKSLMGDPMSAKRMAGVAEHYAVGCPDVLEIAVQGRKEFNGNYVIEPDGKINVGPYGRLRVQDQTLGELSRSFAERISAAPDTVRVRVVEYRSQRLVLIGQVIGWQRTVPYQGQETALDLLQRVGGITPGAAPSDIYVVRTHLGEAQPELFHVDLDAIVLGKNEATNVRLMPSDLVFVGESRQGHLENCIPPWLRPTYQQLWNLLPGDNQPREHENVLSRWIAGEPHGAPAIRKTAGSSAQTETFK